LAFDNGSTKACLFAHYGQFIASFTGRQAHQPAQAPEENLLGLFSFLNFSFFIIITHFSLFTLHFLNNHFTLHFS
jgi:hypothetical protein